MGAFSQRLTQIRNVGLFSFLNYVYFKIRSKLPWLGLPRIFSLTSKGLIGPIYCRGHTSDMLVFEQVFLNREYRSLDDLDGTQVKLIVDCGANVGISAVYFLSRFPHAHLVAVEPDAQNFSQLQTNVSRFKDRVTPIPAAVWKESGEVEFAAPVMGNEWAACIAAGETARSVRVKAISMSSLCQSLGRQRIQILKIDIEDAEAAVFSHHPNEWLGLVDNLVIELHSAVSRDAFFSAMSGGEWDISRCDELTVCRRR